MSIDWINYVFVLGIKWLVLCAVLMVLIQRSRNSSAAELHRVLIVGLITVCGLPLASALAPEWWLPILPEAFAAWLSVPISGISSTWLLLVFAVWLAGALMLLGHLVWQVWQAAALQWHGTVLGAGAAFEIVQECRSMLGIRRPIRLCSSTRIDSPLTFGSLAPVIVLPANFGNWSEPCLRRFIIHELAHIRRHDWLQQTLAQILVAMVWFWPPAWWFLNRAQWYAELACDDMVLRYSGERVAYARDLLNFGERLSHCRKGSVALIQTSVHYQRIEALLDSSRVRGPHGVKWWYAATLLVGWTLLAGMKLGVKPPLFAAMEAEFILAPVVDAANAVPRSECIGVHCAASARLVDKHWLQPGLPPSARFDRKPVVVPRPVSELDWPIAAAPGRAPIVAPLPAPVRVAEVKPKYPRRALRHSLEARVVATYDVLADGSTSNITVQEGPHVNVFDDAVIAAVEQFRYRPASSAQQPAVRLLEVFEFRMIEDAKTHLNPDR